MNPAINRPRLRPKPPADWPFVCPWTIRLIKTPTKNPQRLPNPNKNPVEEL